MAETSEMAAPTIRSPYGHGIDLKKLNALDVLLRCSNGACRPTDACLAMTFNIPWKWSKHYGVPPPKRRYTTDFEHAEWFVAQTLPGWSWTLSRAPSGVYTCTFWADDGSDFDGEGKTAALALLRAGVAVYAYHA